MEAKSGYESKAIVVNKERLFDYAPDYYRKLVPKEIGDIISKYAWDDPNDFENWLERVEPVFKVMYGLKESLDMKHINLQDLRLSLSVTITKEDNRYTQYPPRGHPDRNRALLYPNISEYVEWMKVGLKCLHDCADKKIEYRIQVSFDFDSSDIDESILNEIFNSTGIKMVQRKERFGGWFTHENKELRLTIEAYLWVNLGYIP
jgi:hypothetical protein